MKKVVSKVGKNAEKVKVDEANKSQESHQGSDTYPMISPPRFGSPVESLGISAGLSFSPQQVKNNIVRNPVECLFSLVRASESAGKCEINCDSTHYRTHGVP